MATLSNLVTTRHKVSADFINEDNIESGAIHFFMPQTTQFATSVTATCTWASPTTGKVIIDLWGASGSSPVGRCCGWGIPGNPGAFVRKCFCLTGTALNIQLTMGISCINNPGSFTPNTRGTSGNTCVCWQLGGTDGALCAGGGKGGVFWQNSSSGSIFCCFAAGGYCNTPWEDLPRPYYWSGCQGCGMICNITVPGDLAVATGGDINCNGEFSCSLLGRCDSGNSCSFMNFVRTSAYRFSTEGATLPIHQIRRFGSYCCGAEGAYDLIASLNATSRTPMSGHPWGQCFSGKLCQCNFNPNVLQTFNPVGVPGTGRLGQCNHLVYGNRGGMGAVKITYRN